jgi:hypothetical protein
MMMVEDHDDPSIDPWTERQRQYRLRPDAARYWRPDAARWVKPSLSYVIGPTYARKYNFDPGQPRLPAGDPDGGQWTDANGNSLDSEARTQRAEVIRICIVGSRSLATDRWGNKSYTVSYDCVGGRSIVRSGSGHSFRGFIIDPLN